MRSAAKWVGVALACWLWAASAAAQGTSEPVGWAEKFLDSLMNGGPERAAELLNEETVLGQRVRTVAPLMRDSATKANGSNGTIIGYELVKRTELGTRTLRLIYVVNHQQGATVYRMFFYRGDHGWDLLAMQMEADIMKFDFD